MKFHKMRTRGLNLLLVVLPLLCRGLSAKDVSAESVSTVEKPICDEQLKSKYCDAWYGGDLV